MPVKVRCTSCDKVLTVPDTARGKAVKCPACDTRIAVPTGDSQVSKKDGEKPKKKPVAKASKPVDSEDALASLDLRRAEDANARICSKCGYDMELLDEEETECPKCGYDIQSGGLGVKARKRALKGPDPADFYPGLAKNAFSFVIKNQGLCWRTNLYTLICLLISLFCAFMYLWISAWPPRAFFGLCFTVAFLVIPGWLWYLDTEVIKLTLERKDKFKKLNFDFFLASSKGVIAVAWTAVVVVPLIAIPAGIGYYLVQTGQPEWMMGVCIGVGLIPVIWMLPGVMAHMTMPISMPGWMFWKVIQFWFRTIGGSSVWFMWLLITSIPLIAGAATIGAVWGNDINTIVNTMEYNADINRQLRAAENAPKGKNATPVDVTSIGTPADVDFTPLIGPAIILAVMCLPLGFIGMFNMRTNGVFTFYFRERLELIDKAKEYKYVAKERRDPDDDDAPRTWQKDLAEGVMVPLVCLLMGLIGGMLFGALTNVGVPGGVIAGSFCGLYLAILINSISFIVEGFRESVLWGFLVWFAPFAIFVFIAMHWERTRKLVFQMVTIIFAFIALVICAAVVLGPPAA
ncbi:MAG: hypothetical protein JSS49_17415 [Planctomycetes bacterium]|nr:hypothetical protein [Planctomycetota bacterium]